MPEQLVYVAIRIPRDLLDRTDHLARMLTDPALPAVRRSAAIRIAIARGLDVLQVPEKPGAAVR